MEPIIEEFDCALWDKAPAPLIQERALASLECGKVLYFPQLCFAFYPHELIFFSPEKIDPKRKNISYDLGTDTVGGSLWNGTYLNQLGDMLKRYALTSSRFLQQLLPHYSSHIKIAKTSFRPAEIAGRSSSVRKDDKRLHVDAFPSNPTRGKRILRFFTNVNPDGRPRMWKLGEPFDEVAKKFICTIGHPFPGTASFLKLLHITKDKRSAYDHYMLHIHNRMKEDEHYQRKAQQQEFLFPPGSSWMVYTDQVSHAALAGQHVLEQTFSMPVEGLNDPASSPLKILERLAGRTLV